MSIESSVIHGNEWWSEKQCPVSKSWTNMPFSRSWRSGPLSRRTPAIDSQHLAKYAPLLEKANSVYNSELTAFLKSATPTPPPITPKSDGNGLHLLLPHVICYLFMCNSTKFRINFGCLVWFIWSLILEFLSIDWVLGFTWLYLCLFQECIFLLAPQKHCKELTFNFWWCRTVAKENSKSIQVHMVFLWKTIQTFYFLKEVVGDLLCSVVFFLAWQ